LIIYVFLFGSFEILIAIHINGKYFEFSVDKFFTYNY